MVSHFDFQWSTFNPTVNTGLSTGNPTSSQRLTHSTQWTTSNLTYKQYTISGDTDIVVTSNKINDFEVPQND